MTTVNESRRGIVFDGPGRQRATVSMTPAQLFARSAGLTLPCQTDPELWFADTPLQVEQAKALCQGCALQVDCLAAALDRDEP